MRPFCVLTLILTSPGLTFAANTEPENPAPPRTMKECTAIPTATDRIQCYDEYHTQHTLCATEINPQVRLDCFDGLAIGRGLIRKTPPERELSEMEQRLTQEKKDMASTGAWMILPYLPTYILPYRYLLSGINQQPFEKVIGESDHDGLRPYEVKYQVSFRIPLFEKILGPKTDLMFAYTQISAWQVYSHRLSAPFRNTDYQPELVISYEADRNLGLFDLSVLTLSLTHQSNGQSKPLSRSWNRIVLSGWFSRARWIFHMKTWWRIPESADDDDNPDIETYVGYGELFAYYKYGNQVFGMMLQNNLRTDQNHTNLQLDWSFPAHSRFKGYVQYFDGYKETLLDYDSRNHSVGVGVMLSDIF